MDEAIKCRLPLIFVHDADPNKNGASLADLEAACTVDAHCKHLFDGLERRVIPWHRVSDFQLKSLARVAEELLMSMASTTMTARLPDDGGDRRGTSNVERGGAAPSLYVPGGVAWMEAHFRRGANVYTSRHNGGAAEIARRVSRSCAKDKSFLLSEEELTSAQAQHWMLYLHAAVFSDEAGRRLEKEILEALRRGAPKIVTVYEPAVGSFSHIFEASPRSLHTAKLFDILALEWHAADRFHHPVSLGLLARALGCRLRTSNTIEHRQSSMQRSVQVARHAIETVRDRLASSVSGSVTGSRSGGVWGRDPVGPGHGGGSASAVGQLRNRISRGSASAVGQLRDRISRYTAKVCRQSTRALIEDEEGTMPELEMRRVQ